MHFSRVDRHEAVTRLGMIETKDVLAQDDFSASLLDMVEGRADEISEALEVALERWTSDRLGAAEGALLRLGTAEILCMDDIPPQVTINEYIELAKKYGDDQAPRFINGVLDRVRKNAAPPEGTANGSA